MAAPIAAKPTARVVILNPPPPNLLNTAISANMPAIPANPLIILSVSISPNCFIACDNTTKAPDSINIAVALLKLRLPNLAAAKNNANSVNTPIIANNPALNVSASISPNCLSALAITCKAAPNIIKLADVFASPLDEVLNSLTANTIVPSAVARPTSPVTISPILIVDKVFNAPASISIAVAINIIEALVFISPLMLPTLFMAIIANVNSPNTTAIPANAVAKRAGSILDNTNKDAANIPIAAANLINVPAFKEFWYAVKESLTPSNTSLTFSPIPLNESNTPVKSSPIPLNLSNKSFNTLNIPTPANVLPIFVIVSKLIEPIA